MTAIEKINAEMQKHPDDLYREIIGHYLIDRAGKNAVAESKIEAEDKTLEGALAVVREEARKRANGGVAVLLSDTVVRLVDGYFGLLPDTETWDKTLLAAGRGQGYTPRATAGGASLDLADFL